MELTLYVLFYITAFIMFFTAMLNNKDWQLQMIFTIISFIMFIILAYESLNVELITYQNAAWQTKQLIEYELVFLSIAFWIITLLQIFILASEFVTKTTSVWIRKG